MAKSKIEYEFVHDCFNRPCLKVQKKRGKLSYDEVFEALFDSRIFEGRNFIQEFHIGEELPDDLYDTGDVWYLYEIDDYFKKNWADRLIPKKLDVVSNIKGKMSGICPNCCHEIIKTTQEIHFCEACGQEITWK